MTSSNILVGIIVGTKGVAGDVRVQPHTDNPDRFSIGNSLLISGKELEVEYSRIEKKQYILKLKGVESLEEANSLNGMRLEVYQDDVSPTHPGVYYYYQILDMDVWTISSEYLGKISEIISTGGNDVYVISSELTKDILLPAIGEVILEVDVQNHNMVVAVPEGL
jgi:16S rRNA processing protein RimM